MKKRLRLLALLTIVVMLVGMLPMTALAAGKTRYVKTSNGLSLNVRSSRKTHTDNIVAHLSVGTKVTVLREYSTGWAYISYSGGKGYVVKSCLSATKPSTSSKSSGVTKYISSSDFNYINIRSTMKSHAENIVVSLKVGTAVTVIDTYKGGWSYVKYKTYKGFVQSRYLSDKP